MTKTIIILLAILMFSKTYACTCLENFTLREEIEHSEFIATGKVISYERYPAIRDVPKGIPKHR